MKTLIRILIGLVGVFVLAIAGIGIWLSTLDLDAQRDRIAALATNTLGRSVTIRGPLLPSWNEGPAVRLADITIAGPPDRPRQTLLTLPRLDARIDLATLVRGQFRIADLAADGATLSLVQAADGASNWRLGPTANDRPSGGDNLPGLGALLGGRLHLTDAVVSITTPTDSRRIAIDRLTVGPSAEQGAIAIDGAGQVQGQEIAVMATVSPISGLLDGGPAWPVDARVAIGEAAITVAGDVGLPTARSRFDVRVTASVPDPDAVSEILPPGLDFPMALSLAGRLREVDRVLLFSDLSGALGDTEFAAEVSLTVEGETPRLEGLLSLGRWEGGTDRPAPPSDRLIRDVPIPYGWVGPVEADLQVAVAELAWGRHRLTNAVGYVVVDDGVATITVTDGRLYDGAFTGAVSLNAGQRQAGLTAMVLGGDLGLLLGNRRFAQDISGRMDLDLDLIGTGDRLPAVLGTANGTAGLILGTTDLQSSDLGLLGRSVLTALNRSPQPTSTALSCAAISATITAGIVQSRGLVAETDRATIGGQAAVSLQDETIDIVLRTRNKETNLLPLTPIVRVTGTILDPQPSTDVTEMIVRSGAGLLLGAITPAAVLVPLVQPGAGGARCAQALDDGPLTDPLVAPIAGAARATGHAIGQAGQAVGQGIERVGDGTGAVLDQAGRAASSTATAIGDAATEAAEAASETINSLGQGLQGLFGQ